MKILLILVFIGMVSLIRNIFVFTCVDSLKLLQFKYMQIQTPMNHPIRETVFTQI